jgi:hypothetical protein
MKVQGGTNPGLFVVEAEGKESLEVLKSLTGYEAAHAIAEWHNAVPEPVATVKSKSIAPKGTDK